MKKRNCNDVTFSDPSKYSWASKKRKIAKFWFPNSLGVHKATNTGYLVGWRSPEGVDFSLSKAALEYLSDAKNKKKITQGYVLLMEGSESEPGDLVSRLTVYEVMVRTKGIGTQDGRWGKYWWVDADGLPRSSGNSLPSAFTDDFTF